MADDNDLMTEFQEFLNAKKAKEQEEKDSEDFPVEIWDKDGRGVRTKRSHAKPFLQSLGLDLDDESEDTDQSKNGDNSGSKTKPKGDGKAPAGKSGTGATGGIARKYFTKPSK